MATATTLTEPCLARQPTSLGNQTTVTLQLHPLNWPRHQWFACDPTDADWFEGVDPIGADSAPAVFARYFDDIESGAARLVTDLAVPASPVLTAQERWRNGSELDTASMH